MHHPDESTSSALENWLDKATPSADVIKTADQSRPFVALREKKPSTTMRFRCGILEDPYAVSDRSGHLLTIHPAQESKVRRHCRQNIQLSEPTYELIKNEFEIRTRGRNPSQSLAAN